VKPVGRGQEWGKKKQKITSMLERNGSADVSKPKGPPRTWLIRMSARTQTKLDGGGGTRKGTEKIKKGGVIY